MKFLLMLNMDAFPASIFLTNLFTLSMESDIIVLLVGHTIHKILLDRPSLARSFLTTKLFTSSKENDIIVLSSETE